MKHKKEAGWASEHTSADVPTWVTDCARLTDISWHNDAMPCFALDRGDGDGLAGWRLWVDYADPDARETAGAPRFAFILYDADGSPIDDGDGVAVVWDFDDETRARDMLARLTRFPIITGRDSFAFVLDVYRTAAPGGDAQLAAELVAFGCLGCRATAYERDALLNYAYKATADELADYALTMAGERGLY